MVPVPATSQHAVSMQPATGYVGQGAVLCWVQQNIPYLGGDPGLVTIFCQIRGWYNCVLSAYVPHVRRTLPLCHHGE